MIEIGPGSGDAPAVFVEVLAVLAVLLVLGVSLAPGVLG
jgi:hypothetical protein